MNSTTLSPKASLAKLALYPKPRPFKVMVLGQSGVGKSALVVRFITRRFIGEYDPNLEKIYSFQTVIDNETVRFEILDSAGYDQGSEYSNLESNIRWAEAFILMYSVTDKCSYDECHRLKFLINYIKKRRRLASPMKDSIPETPVVLVGNKIDQGGDRMVSTDEGQRRSKEIGCICFHEISIRESIDQVCSVFRDARRFWRVGSRWSRDVHSALTRPLARAASDTSDSTIPIPNTTPCQRYTEIELDEEDEVSLVRCDSTSSSGQSECTDEFRARASTDSRLPPRPERQRHPPSTGPLPPPDSIPETPVVLVGNKTDQGGDRMVNTDEGQRRSKEIGCVCFHEISVRESIEQVCSVFRDARRFWRVGSRWTRDVHSALPRPLARATSETSDSIFNTTPCQRYTEIELDEDDEVSLVRCDSTSSSGQSECTDEFRARASTDSRLPPRPERQRHPPSTRPLPPPVRRMSVAMRGNNASTY